MKNKMIVFAALGLLFAGSAAQARWGLDFAASPWKMDVKDLETSNATYNKAVTNANTTLIGFHSTIDQESLSGVASFFVEGDSKARLGFSLGYGAMPTVSFKLHKIMTAAYNDTSLETRTTYVPADLYLKFGSKSGKSSFLLGGGGDFIMVSNEYRFTNSAGSTNEEATFTQKKVVPHAQAGFEFFLAKWLSFGVNAKYVFSGVLDKMEGNLKSNGVDAGKKKLVMVNDGPGGINGVKLGYRSTSFTFTGQQRPYRYDYSGLRVNLAMRLYFGAGGKTSKAAEQKQDQSRPVTAKDKPAVQAPAPEVQPAPAAESESLKLEREKLELEKARLDLEREKLEFEKQKKE